MERPNQTFVGTGKRRNPSVCKENEISRYLMMLSPSQQQNISKVIVECKILDRTHLILDIFAQRAETSYAEPSRVGTMPIPTKAFWNVDT
jgi:GTP-binding protein HflX